MSYKIKMTKRFEKDVKRCVKRHYPIDKLKIVISLLEKEGKLPQQYRPHKLSGNLAGLWECHITPDWLLIWRQNDTELVLLLVDTGSHSDIF